MAVVSDCREINLVNSSMSRNSDYQFEQEICALRPQKKRLPEITSSQDIPYGQGYFARVTMD